MTAEIKISTNGLVDKAEKTSQKEKKRQKYDTGKGRLNNYKWSMSSRI